MGEREGGGGGEREPGPTPWPDGGPTPDARRPSGESGDRRGTSMDRSGDGALSV